MPVQSVFVGHSYESNRCGKYVVTNYKNASNVTIKFIDSGYEKIVTTSLVYTGEIKDPYSPNTHGVGFVGVGKHCAAVDRVATRKYKTWVNMIERCYAKKIRYKSYWDCFVCSDWLNFQLFGDWYDLNYSKGLQLDKDIKIKGNREYCPGACLFVTQNENVMAARNKDMYLSVVINSDGDRFDVFNQSEFCSKHGLHRGHFNSMINGKVKSHKGWKLYEL